MMRQQRARVAFDSMSLPVEEATVEIEIVSIYERLLMHRGWVEIMRGKRSVSSKGAEENQGPVNNY